MVRAKRLVSSGCRGMLKKQSFKSIIIHCQSLGIIVGNGNPGCKGPMSSIEALTARKSCKKHHFPDFFLITNTGEFQGLVDGTRCPCCTSCLTSSCRAISFSFVMGHWATHMGSSDRHVKRQQGRGSPVAPCIKPAVKVQYVSELLLTLMHHDLTEI